MYNENTLQHKTIIALFERKEDTTPYCVIMIGDYDKPNKIQNILDNVLNDNRYFNGGMLERQNLLYITLINELFEDGIYPLNRINKITPLNTEVGILDPIISGQKYQEEILYRIFEGGCTIHTPNKQYTHNNIPKMRIEKEYSYPINKSFVKQKICIIHNQFNVVGFKMMEGANLLEPKDIMEIAEYEERDMYNINPYRLKKELIERNFDVDMEVVKF